jgi:coenzyme F420 hydrogenase subunit beta
VVDGGNILNLLRNVVEEIVKYDLCTGCGTCAGICPQNALEMRLFLKKGIFIPEVTSEKCNDCGLCLKVCPGKELDLIKLRQQFFETSLSGQDDIIYGRLLDCFVGDTNDVRIRECSSSGGLVTSLLVMALEEKIIDGALVTRMSSVNPCCPESFIARTSTEVLAAANSKYCPVPLNTALREIIRNEGRYAVVGLPCHLHGIRKAEEQHKELRKRIVLHFGIFCSHTVNYKGTKFLLEKLGVAEEQVTSMSYRTRGWPGGFQVTLRSGEERFIPLGNYWAPLFGRFFFTPWRCTLCPDGLAELADISFGDAWLPEFARERQGKSIIMVRSQEGKELVDLALRKGRVELVEVESNKVFESQRDQILFKKKSLAARKKLAQISGKKVPDYGETSFLKTNSWDYFTAFIIYINMKVSEIKAGRSVLMRIPLAVLNCYGRLMQKLFNASYSGYKYLKTKPVAKLPPKIVIINSYSPNIGDLSIISTMVDTFRRSFPKAAFTVFATDPGLTENYLADVTIKTSFGSRSDKPWRQLINIIKFIRNWIWLFFIRKGINLFFLARRKTRRALYEYHEADVIISCGGGYLNDNSGCAFLGCLFDAYLGIAAKKPTVFYAQSIGPFTNRFYKTIAGKVINSVDLITLRDKVSFQFLKELGVARPKTVAAADAALLLPLINKTAIENILSREKIKKPLVTITVKPWHFPGHAEPEHKKQLYLKCLRTLISYIVNQLQANVLIVPMDIEKKPGSERGFMRCLKDILKKHIVKISVDRYKSVYDNESNLIESILLNAEDNYGRIRLLNGVYSPAEIKSIINLSDVHVATRMHSSIYAAAQGIPVLGIAYEPKMSSFMEALEQKDYLLDIGHIDEDLLIKVFNCIWENREQVSKLVSEKVDTLKKRALISAELVSELLSEIGSERYAI